MTVTIPTSEAQYGYVVGRVIRAVGDTTDADDKPDAVAAAGKVTFTPKAALGRTTDYSAFIVREKIDAPLDADIILSAGQVQTTQAILDVYGYAATHHKVLSGHAAGGVNAGNANFGVVTVGGRWASSAAVASITVTPSGADQGRMDLYLYGVN